MSTSFFSVFSSLFSFFFSLKYWEEPVISLLFLCFRHLMSHYAPVSLVQCMGPTSISKYKKSAASIFFFFQCARINGKCFGTALAFKKIIIKSKNGWNLGMRNLLILSPYIGQDFTHFKHLSNAIARIDIKWKVKLKWVSLTYSSGLSSD